jgi:hypothetical protein
MRVRMEARFCFAKTADRTGPNTCCCHARQSCGRSSDVGTLRRWEHRLFGAYMVGKMSGAIAHARRRHSARFPRVGAREYITRHLSQATSTRAQLSDRNGVNAGGLGPTRTVSHAAADSRRGGGRASDRCVASRHVSMNSSKNSTRGHRATVNRSGGSAHANGQGSGEPKRGSRRLRGKGLHAQRESRNSHTTTGYCECEHDLIQDQARTGTQGCENAPPATFGWGEWSL